MKNRAKSSKLKTSQRIKKASKAALKKLVARGGQRLGPSCCITNRQQ